MRQELSEIMDSLNRDYSNGELTGVSLVESTKGGGVKYRYSPFVTAQPAHFIGYLTAMCSELADLLTSTHN